MVTAPTSTTGLVATRISVEGPEGRIVHPLDLAIEPGRSLAIIGESGSGKSMTARALTGLLPRGVTASGTATIDGTRYELGTQDEKHWAKVRGSLAVLLLQDPFTSLSPVIRCGKQIEATILARCEHRGEPKPGRLELRDEVALRLDEVSLSADIARKFPSELSGGMRQRVAIAAALAAMPSLLIADEPTTALDASTQGEVLDLLAQLRETHQMSVMLISHDLGVVWGRADDIMVMRAGEVVEQGTTAQVLSNPTHEYTQKLLEASLSVTDQQAAPAAGDALLVVDGMTKRFGSFTALHEASLTLREKETVAIVGESGSGKTTFARCIAGLDTPDEGTVTLDGRVLSSGRKGRVPSEMQIVFQDPYSTLNPIFTVGQTLNEALAACENPQGGIDELLDLVELDRSLAARRPSQLSGGQRQRVAIARALAPRPRVLICDESVSALDVSVQRQILDLLLRLRDELGLAILFITHDLGVVANIAQRTIVVQAGEVVEHGTTSDVLENPQHSYTKVLVNAAKRESITRHDSTHDTTHDTTQHTAAHENGLTQ